MRASFLFLVLLVVACGPSSGDDDGMPAADADPFAPDADPFAPDADPSAPDAGTAPAFPTCQLGCGTAADCVIAGSTLYDLDNYACTGGLCRWLGCNSTSECATLGTAYVCGSLAGDAFDACYHSCNVAADCALGNALHDADNYACTQNLCRWQGCNGDGECQSTLGAGYVCRTLPGTGLDSCVEACVTPADCVVASTLYDEDNWDCAAGACRWSGCNSTAECQGALSNTDYVCQ